MLKKTKTEIFIFLIISGFLNLKVFALSYSEINTTLSEIFINTVDDNEGLSTFRSTLIPFGGRSESLGNAYTGLCDDISFLRYNAGAGAIQKETQLSLFHNTWIADSKLETLAYTTRLQKHPNLSLGGYISCFYLPFTEYNIFGDRVAGSYYSETIGAFNISYNFLAGYDFKGLSLGTTIKAGWRGMPDYTDNDTNEIISKSGLQQSGLAIMADIGLLIRFNFLKFYYSRDPNIRFGLAIKNLGVSLTGFGNEIIMDDALPATISAGISITIINPITITVDYSQPINLQDLSVSLTPYFGSGVSFQFTSFLSLLAGFGFKGSTPQFSAGFEFEISKIRFNLNYSLDFTSSFSPLNRISLSTKLLLGDKGRSKIDQMVDEYYQLGLVYYAQADWENAILVWKEALKLNRRFDPAILGIQSAQYQIEMFKKIKESLLLD